MNVTLMIPRNVGSADRVVRVVAGGAAAAAPLALGASWVVAAPVALFAGGIVLSGLLGRCSVYHALGVSTSSVNT
ncbi:MAG: DUF2892 domain-containing protein [Myxococcales bacterium]|nr:DUF2892 domain-containing protein [Myxococcales bacterium]MCB9690116.1 DUF2892 domain-containing protein [Alphaproteobacteria bacterium]